MSFKNEDAADTVYIQVLLSASAFVSSYPQFHWVSMIHFFICEISYCNTEMELVIYAQRNSDSVS